MLKHLLQKIFATMFFSTSYTSELEDYIVARKPKDVFDIERLQAEYTRGRIKYLWNFLVKYMTSCYIGLKHFTNIAKVQKTNIIDIAKNINII